MVRWHSAWCFERMTVKDAYALKEMNRTMLHQDAIQKEMENVKIVFPLISKGEKPPNGFQYINCHMVFVIKMEDFQRKAHLVASCHKANASDIITYYSVVTRENLCISLTMAVLHNQEVKAGDVYNAYVMTPNHEMI